MAKLNPPVKIKVCGMTQLGDAMMAVDCGADAVGFIFFKKSPRNVSESAVKKIVKHLPPYVNRVGVFVNETAERINRRIEVCGLDTVQLHGDESPAFCRKIKVPVIKAFRMKNVESLAGLSKYSVNGFLLDAFDEEQYGGTGQTFNWKWARGAKKYGKVILAGGLTPANVASAVLQVQPYGVDVCSGVEKSPGKKDPQKIRKFFKAVRGK